MMLLLIGVVVLGRVREFLFDDLRYALGPGEYRPGDDESWLPRAAWDWVDSDRSLYRILNHPSLDVDRIPPQNGPVREAVIATIDADRAGSHSAPPVCAACGGPTGERRPRPAVVDLRFEHGGHLCVRAWVHSECFDRLPEAEGERTIDEITRRAG